MEEKTRRQEFTFGSFAKSTIGNTTTSLHHICVFVGISYSFPCVSFIVSDIRSCIYIELVLYLITFKNVKSKGHLFCLSKLIVMLQICFDTIALSSVVNVINVTTPKNRGAKSETPDAISGT